MPLVLLPAHDPRRQRALEELARLGSSALGDGRLVGTSVFERGGESRASLALDSAAALEHAVRAWQTASAADNQSPDDDTTRRLRDAERAMVERLNELEQEVGALARERSELARDRLLAETNVTSIDHALLLADVLRRSLTTPASEADALVAERAREALQVIRDRQEILRERSVTAHQAIAALELLDAQVVAANAAVTRVIAATSVALRAAHGHP